MNLASSAPVHLRASSTVSHSVGEPRNATDLSFSYRLCAKTEVNAEVSAQRQEGEALWVLVQLADGRVELEINLATGHAHDANQWDGDELVAGAAIGPFAPDDHAGLLRFAQRVIEVLVVAALVVQQELEQVHVALELDHIDRRIARQVVHDIEPTSSQHPDAGDVHENIVLGKRQVLIRIRDGCQAPLSADGFLK